MRQILFLTLILSIFSVQISAQKTIAVQSNGTATFHTDWASAWATVTAGDTIYLPGGTFNIGSLNIDKQVAIIGIGHDPTQTHDSLFSHLNGNIYLAEGSDGSLLHGFRMGSLYFYNYNNSTNQNIENITISRCRISHTYLGYSLPSPVQDILFTENVLNGRIYGRNAQNIQFYKNIFDDEVTEFNGNVILANNFFYSGRVANYNLYAPLTSVHFILVENNIFRTPHYPLKVSENNLLRNNIFAANITIDPQTDLNTWQANFFNQPLNTVFVDYNDGLFSPANDYHLMPGCVGIGAGSDGYDIGIYGTAVPYKEGAVPFNPQVVFEQVSNQTDENGNIGIEVEIIAQPR